MEKRLNKIWNGYKKSQIEVICSKEDFLEFVENYISVLNQDTYLLKFASKKNDDDSYTISVIYRRKKKGE